MRLAMTSSVRSPSPISRNPSATPRAVAPRANGFDPFGSRVTSFFPRRSASAMLAGVKRGPLTWT